MSLFKKSRVFTDEDLQLYKLHKLGKAIRANKPDNQCTAIDDVIFQANADRYDIKLELWPYWTWYTVRTTTMDQCMSSIDIYAIMRRILLLDDEKEIYTLEKLLAKTKLEESTCFTMHKVYSLRESIFGVDVFYANPELLRKMYTWLSDNFPPLQMGAYEVKCLFNRDIWFDWYSRDMFDETQQYLFDSYNLIDTGLELQLEEEEL
jgi:hypothetical protein